MSGMIQQCNDQRLAAEYFLCRLPDRFDQLCKCLLRLFTDHKIILVLTRIFCDRGRLQQNDAVLSFLHGSLIARDRCGCRRTGCIRIMPRLHHRHIAGCDCMTVQLTGHIKRFRFVREREKDADIGSLLADITDLSHIL